MGTTVDVNAAPGEWFHGTLRSRTKFSEWIIPPPVISDEGIGTHTAVFLARDRIWASHPGNKMVCRARLTPEARVLDLRVDSAESEALRERLLTIEHGTPWCHTRQLRAKEGWRAGWETGGATRFHPADFQLESFSRLQARADNALQNHAARRHVQQSDIDAVVEIMTLNRALIEAICVEAKGLGFSVMVGREPGRGVPGPELPRDILAVFEAASLTPPVWD